MTGSGSKISDLVKEMVKEMDANDFYARGDIYDESLEVTLLVEVDVPSREAVLNPSVHGTHTLGYHGPSRLLPPNEAREQKPIYL